MAVARLRRFSGSLISAAVLGGLGGYFVLTAWVGIDFGSHYDESYYIDALNAVIDRLDGFHGHYTYNGLYFLPGLVYMAVDSWPMIEAIRGALAAHPLRPVELDTLPEAAPLVEHLRALVTSKSFLLDLRLIFAVITSFTILWVYLAGRTLFPDSRVAPLMGAAFVALSWEIGYHGRFVAPDTMLMQMAALQLLFLARFARAPGRAGAIGWIMLAAVAGGLGMGVKLTGMFLSLPLAFLLAFPAGGASVFDWRQRLGLLFAAGFGFALAFLATTPGAIWDPLNFLGHVDYEWLNYTQLPPDHPYRVDGVIARLWVFALWFAAELPSPWTLPSLILSAVAAAGLLVLARRYPMLLTALLGFAAIYLWFLAQHLGVYIRNSLILAPLVAVAFAAGCRWLGELAAERAWLWWFAVIGFAAVFAANGYWLQASARSVDGTTRLGLLGAFNDYAKEQRGRLFWLSPSLHVALRDELGAPMVCGAVGVGAVDADAAMALFQRERSWRAWRANDRGFVEQAFSSDDVNLIYAPSWEGRQKDNRIMVLDAGRAGELGVALGAYLPCRHPNG